MTTSIKNYLSTLTPSQKDNMMALRAIILSSDDNISESIKWGSICFQTDKNICGFKVAKNHITLVFFDGVKLKDQHQLLNGSGTKVRTLKYDGNQALNEGGIQDLMRQAIRLK